MPGEPEQRLCIDRKANGVYIDPETINQLLNIASAFDVDTQTLQQKLTVTSP